MNIVDLTCKKSVSFSKNYNTIRVCKQILLLGGYHQYLSFLYFDLPPYSSIKKLVHAKLILFKQPMSQCNTPDLPCNCQKECCHHYVAVPLLEFFSTYSRLYQVPKADYSKQVVFHDDECLCYTEIDITAIVQDWKNGSMENRGLLLIGDDCNKPICYASEKNMNKTMIPIIRLIYEENACCLGLSSTPCVVDIKEF